MNNEIYLFHQDWNGKCLISNNTITRIDNKDESGSVLLKKNKINITWNKWGIDEFIYITDNFYVEKNYLNKDIDIFYFLKKDNYKLTIYDKKLKQFLFYTISEISINEFILLNDIKYKFYLDNIYIDINDIDFFFYLSTQNYNKKVTYILNKFNYKFFDINDRFNCGNYNIDNNILFLKWQNGKIKKYLSNVYHEIDDIYYENIKVIKPQSIFINNKLLFSHISYVNHQIICTSVHYIYEPWNYDKIIFKIKNNKIINKYYIFREDYESIFIYVIELEKINEKEKLEISYEDQIFEINLNQLQLPKKKIYSMTLFKDDYQLLKKYMEYYSNMGIDCFIFYYNDQINNDFLNEINMINQSKYQIILVEWNYDYWWNTLNQSKHHHAQTMAMNDALYILKHFADYILFNDLDEYIQSDIYFKQLIYNHLDIDIFIFKCQFCQMGNDLIKYSNFYFEYDEKKIIKGNYWDKYREKNLIKTNTIHLMGIHNIVTKYCHTPIKSKNSGLFYHFINFFEKNRPELMYEYIM